MKESYMIYVDVPLYQDNGVMEKQFFHDFTVTKRFPRNTEKSTGNVIIDTNCSHTLHRVLFLNITALSTVEPVILTYFQSILINMKYYKTKMSI